ncbi:GNAT family N-acetyltransferase [Streptomyces sp. NBC_00257]|uniref:GNAT family N-acetyltransferase n=1 Tax=Streptomyces TaxID=1883 RepID=UPI00224D68E7|nr:MULTISPECIES: GNAT family N-acetyltransferase [unclassified Streptomyces]WTB59213.1 GNAT family N-acetyltransferase [Streptomyces sp. NBC_00826]WTH87913.1 GNAT family N-acetyltransferase [Streptomyces sp. NBC_00825]WTH96640.1 GNAT family N-acetyltransferase [Streptomyces sp. NBC_00822]MCX4870117.1 GNAT family N-acetyltransferase [Streptomyces sp. NBC_00906]MCX4901280.1 GNAT family N-acetyltransferase [Streptomyces sp. NBC_00892]
MQIRPMREGDLRSAERTSAATFLEAEELNRRIVEPEVQPRSAEASALWIDRMRLFLTVDPGGCWVAEDNAGEIAGFAISQNRDRLWYLATYGVLPGRQGQGVGRGLMNAALAHAGDRQGIFISSVHPGATRRYRLAGFSLHSQVRMTGTVDRSALAAVTGLDEGGTGDFDWMDRLDTDLRGAGHGPDHAFMLATLRLIVSRSDAGRGYAYIDDRGHVALLAAAHEETARALLWEALASSQEEAFVPSITTVNEWAMDVGLAAGLDIVQEGYVAVRDMEAPGPYLASGHFL